MLAALSWLLDLNPAESSSSSTTSSVSYQHSRSSSSGSSSTNNTNVPHAVPPTTFTDARGEAVVAELQVSSTTRTTNNNGDDTNEGPRLSVSNQGVRRDTQQRDDSLFADLQVQGSAFFASPDNRDEITYTAASQHTAPTWNLSTYTSETVSISPLPSPSYGQAPANPSAAFYSLAEHGATAVASHTLWPSDAVVPSACFSTSDNAVAGGKGGFSSTTAQNHNGDTYQTVNRSEGQINPKKARAAPAVVAVPVAVEAPRNFAATTDFLKSIPSVPSAVSQAKSVTNTADALHTTAMRAAKTELPSAAVTATDVAVPTPQRRILEWDEEVCERCTLMDDTEELTTATAELSEADVEEMRIVVEKPALCVREPPLSFTFQHDHQQQRQMLSAFVLTAKDPTPDFSLLSPSPTEHVVHLRPSNPFLTTNVHTATALPSLASAQLSSSVASSHAAFAPLPPANVLAASTDGKEKDGNSVLMVSLAGLCGGRSGDAAVAANVSNPYTFMEHPPCRRSEELLLQGGEKGEASVVEFGNGLVTLTAMVPHSPCTPSRTPTSTAPPSKPIVDFS